MKLYDYSALLFFILSFFGYQYFYFLAAYKYNRTTRETIINGYRELWLKKIIAENQPIIAIQTLRNLIMTGTFLVSLDMLLIGGIASILSSNINFVQSMNVINGIDFHTFLLYLHEYPAALKIFVTIFMLLLSAYNFTIMVRILYNMNFTTSATSKDENIQFQLEQIRRQARHFITGIRSLYFAIGPLIWLIDTTLMLVFTAVITISFYRFDFATDRKY